MKEFNPNIEKIATFAKKELDLDYLSKITKKNAEKKTIQNVIMRELKLAKIEASEEFKSFLPQTEDQGDK